MSAVRVLTEGEGQGGVSWKLTVGGDDESYTTLLETRDSAGIIDCWGVGGPKLWQDCKLNVYVRRNSAEDLW